MAKYNVEHACGHSAEYQLFGKHKERDRKIEWMEGQDCPECRKAAFNATQAEAAAKVDDADLPALTGSEKQVNWARTVRASKVAEIRKTAGDALPWLRERGEAHKADLLERAVRILLAIDSSHWWIENREYGARGLIQDQILELAKSEPEAVRDAIQDAVDQVDGYEGNRDVRDGRSS